jgi:hypothetical protein
MLTEAKRRQPDQPEGAALRAAELLRGAVEAMVPLVVELAREELRRDPPPRRLYTVKELAALPAPHGWPEAKLRWWLETRRRELEDAGAVVMDGRSVLIDPERLDEVLRRPRAPVRRRRRVG